MGTQEVSDLLRGTDPQVSPFKRRPYALLRDRQKRYFFVDTGIEPKSKDFRVYMGPRGRLERMTMTNVVNDSEGVIFETQPGTLRLVIEGENSSWTRRGRTSKLVRVPIDQNLNLAYSGLGVYMGKPLGTPCDIF